MLGYRFNQFKERPQSTFDTLFEMLQELLVYTSGDLNEALDWLNQLDRQYGITTPDYGMGDFIQELKDRGFIREENPETGAMRMTSKLEQSIRKSSLDQIFSKLKKSQSGNHKTKHTGTGDENSADSRQFVFGDSHDQIDFQASIKKRLYQSRHRRFYDG